MKKRVMGVMGLVALVAGCSTLKVDSTRAAAIRKVAIAGFSLHQQLPEGLKVGSDEPKGMINWGSGLGEQAAHADAMYESLAATLAKENGWKVAARDTVRKAPVYARWFEAKMKGLQNRPPLAAGLKAYGASGIIDAWPIERMTLNERRELLEKLGVEGLVAATVTIQLKDGGGLKRLVGAGEYRPVATVRFALYDGRSETPVWMDAAARGDASQEGVAHVFGVTGKPEALHRASVRAAESSFRQLIARYRQPAG